MNELIANYIGMQKTDLGWYDSEEVLKHLHKENGGNTFEILKFDKSWDWLIPTIDTILGDSIDPISDGMIEEIELHYGNREFNKLYYAIANSIKYLNEYYNSLTFKQYLKTTRDNFTLVVSKYSVTDHLNLRTAVDDFLIAFDQAKDRVNE